MNINALFELLDSELSENKLKGYIELDGNCIIWSYDSKEIDPLLLQEFLNEIKESDYYIEGETNIEIYNNDIDEIKTCLEKNNEIANWYFSKPDIIGSTIIFRIF
jgi:hypothetical protein